MTIENLFVTLYKKLKFIENINVVLLFVNSSQSLDYLYVKQVFFQLQLTDNNKLGLSTFNNGGGIRGFVSPSWNVSNRGVHN